MHTRCGNCSAELSGPYCSQCGQHAHESARSLGALLHGGWHDLTHLDGRIWQTLRLLLLRPGELSRQYFANQRSRFLPPLRLYLIISVACFGLLALGLQGGEGGQSVQFVVDAGDCESVGSDIPGLQPRLQAACRQIVAGKGGQLGQLFLAALPRAMFLFLPVIAAFMMLFYWMPRRFYVEHLVFFVHNHSAVYIGMALLVLVGLLPFLDPVSGWIKAAFFLWALVYLYRAMRRFYQQGRWLTGVKLVALGGLYVAALMAMMALTLLYSALRL